MTPILDLDDWALSLFADGTLLYSEPAVALETDGQLTFGKTAASFARIHPRRINQAFLTRLSADPLPQPFRSARNHADLFYQQLRALAALHPMLTREPVLMIVRGTTSADQLGLILGIASECGIRVGGFVDRGIAALASIGGMGERACLEFASDHAEVSRARLGADVVRTGIDNFPGLGIRHIEDGWANVIADAFIRHSRFDPLHSAATEQQLYDAIRDWYEQGEARAALTIEHQQEVRRVDIHRDALEQKLLDRIDPVLEALGAGSTVCLGPNASATPGLVPLMRTRGLQPIAVNREALLRYVERHVSPLSNPDEVRFLTTLPAGRSPALATLDHARTAPQAPAPRQQTRTDTGTEKRTAPAASAIVAEPGRPTHGLHGIVAYPIGGPELPATLLGDDPRSGVTIEFGGRLFTLIEVRN